MGLVEAVPLPHGKKILLILRYPFDRRRVLLDLFQRNDFLVSPDKGTGLVIGNLGSSLCIERIKEGKEEMGIGFLPFYFAFLLIIEEI